MKKISLEMKYFVLKPRSKFYGDPYAAASREAMRAYATMIQYEDIELSASLKEWADMESENNDNE
jgi:hypothetical protein